MFYCPQKKFGILTLVEKVYFVTKLLPPIQNESDKESEERTVPQIQKQWKMILNWLFSFSSNVFKYGGGVPWVISQNQYVLVENL